MIKPFSKQLYFNDALARQATFNIFKESRNLTVEDIPDQYGVDLILLKGINKVCGLELEVKKNWVGQRFPFQNVQFLERKSHYRNVLWVLFNSDCTAHLTAKIGDILTCEKRIIPNKYLKDEAFYIIPLEKVQFNGLYRLMHTLAIAK